MDKKETNITAGDGAVAAETIHGDITINNTYLTKSGFTEEEIKDKEAQYLGWVMENCGGLDWLSLMELKEGQGGLALDSVYTALLTKSRHENKNSDQKSRSDMGMSDDKDPVRQGRLSAVELLNKEQKLVLLGDPGSGKSAFVDFLCLCMAGQQSDKNINLNTLTEPLPDNEGRPQQREIEVEGKEEPETEAFRQQWDHGALIPVKIILRDFAASPHFPVGGVKPSPQNVLAFLEAEFKTLSFEGYFDILKNRLQNGQVLVMFDGLDEVAQAGDRRKQLVTCIDLFSKSFNQCRFLVTCRPYAYRDPDWQLPRFDSDELDEFQRGQVIRFIERWYQQLPTVDRDKTIARGQQLQNAILGRPALRDLAKRPLLLSLIAYLHAYRHGLPDRRADLYEKLLDLLVDKWEKARFDVNDDDVDQARKLSQASLAEYLQMGKDSILNVLKKLAFEAHASQDGSQDTADISGRDLHHELLCAAEECGNTDAKALELSEHLRDRVGILYQRSGSTTADAVYTFPHRSFQEYLAAEYFRGESGAMFERFEESGMEFKEFTWQELAAKLARTDPDRWREVVVLAGGIRSESDSASVWNLLKELSILQDNKELSEEDAWGLRLASEILAESANLKDMNPRQKSIFEKIQNALPKVLGTSKLLAKERVQTARYLARIGDPRPEVMDVDVMNFCFVPKGEFWMGFGEHDEKGEHFSLKETPSGGYNLSYDYWVAQSPISTSQFKDFVTESGFEVGDNDALIGAGNTPVVWISQDEAQAFCQWLTIKWRASGLLPKEWSVRLPNEPEWEKAARGGFEIPDKAIIKSIAELISHQSSPLIINMQPQRRYPFLSEISTEVVNFEGKVEGSTTAGIYPLGQSPYGCYDLSGNVWEWTCSEKSDYPFPAVGTEAWGKQEAKEFSACVMRGGSFLDPQNDVRCAFRIFNWPDGRGNLVGFRVVLSPSL